MYVGTERQKKTSSKFHKDRTYNLIKHYFIYLLFQSAIFPPFKKVIGIKKIVFNIHVHQLTFLNYMFCSK